MFPSASWLVEESFRGGKLSGMQSRRLEKRFAWFLIAGTAGAEGRIFGRVYKTRL